MARISLFFFFFLPMLKLFKVLLTNWSQQYHCGETMTLPSVRIYISPLSLPFNNSICTPVLLLQIILFFLSLPCSRRQGTSVYPESSFSWVPTGRKFFFFVSFIILNFSRLYWHEFSWAQWVRKQGAKWWLRPIHNFFFPKKFVFFFALFLVTCQTPAFV